ncbi:MAG: von Willebrand factor type A domain-containing protein [Pirellulales bacterium]
MQDSTLDESLREVPIPEGLLARLRAVPADEIRGLGDDGLDAWIRGAGPSDDMLDRCRRIARPGRHAAPWRQWAVAASLVLLVGVSYASSVAAVVLATPDRQAASTPLFASGALEHDSDSAEWEIQLAGLVPKPADWSVAEIETLDLQSLATTDDLGAGADPTKVFSDDSTWTLLATADSRLQQVGNRFPRHGFIDAALNSGAPLHAPASRGIGAEPPRLDAFRLWQQSTGVHAEVVPAAAAGLEVSAVPLRVDTASFAEALASIRQGALPAPASIRVEDFLASMEYGFHSPSNPPVALKTAAGPSPFGGENAMLLQVAVHAPSLKPAPRPPAWLTIVVDGSSSMRREGAIESVRRALLRLIGQLEPQDRLSLVVYHHDSEVLADHLSPRQIDQWLIACQGLSADGAGDLLAGLTAGYGLALAGPGDEEPNPSLSIARHVVWISDGGPALNDKVFDRVSGALAAAAGDGVRLHAIDVSGGVSPDREMARCIHAVRGQLHRAVSSEEIGWGLQAALSGQSSVVATNATLTVTFDPRVVATYRLLGHEARRQQGEWLPARVASEIHAGQTSTALYELRFWPNQREVVAEARLHWRNPRDGVSRETVRTVRRAEFAATFADSAPSLQAAALAAELAEVLRHSYFADSGSLRNVLEVSRQASPALKETAAWHELAELLDRGWRIKPPKDKP